MTGPDATDAALVREARAQAQQLREARPGSKHLAVLLDRLAAAAERADEAEKRLAAEREWSQGVSELSTEAATRADAAEAALLAAREIVAAYVADLDEELVSEQWPENCLAARAFRWLREAS